MKTFGAINGNYDVVGTNAKMTEFNAAMGLANLKYIKELISERKKISEMYDKLLDGVVERPITKQNLEYNYSYYPVIFKNEEETLNIIKKLNDKEIFPRRYFYPSLNTLKYIEKDMKCPISEDITKRILCLPLYNGLKESEVIEICNIIKN